MKRYYYDFHIHSCLSPCADDDSTPNNIAGMAKLCSLDIIALTDHNSAKNCPAFFSACERYGIVPIAGTELTTSEDIHVVCLFEKLSDAMSFDTELQKHRIFIKNRKEIFGNQLILDENDEVIGEEENLLSNATDISLEDVIEFAERFNGICYPAHIDRPSNGVIEILGTFPSTPHFSIVEINNKDKVKELTEKYALEDKTVIISSDAHYLTDIRDKENFFELECDDEPDSVRKALFEKLREI